MVTSYRAFLVELYEEYLSDGSFVAQQRKKLLADPSGKWGPIRNWEDRLEAYIDGLLVGGDLALEVCRRKAAEGDPGELLCALKVFVRSSRFDLVEQAVVPAKPDEEPKAAVVADALLHEKHPELPKLIRRLIELDSRFLPPLARVIGHRRLPMGDLLAGQSLEHSSVVWALGRLREQRSAEALSRLVRTSTEEAKTNAGLALLRIDNSLDSRSIWAPIADGMMGDPVHLRAFLRDPEPSSSLALGLLGAAEAIPHLISRLPQPEAATALQLITGADMVQDIPVEDETLDLGERPTTVAEIASDAEMWNAWWDANREKFEVDSFFRSGRHYSVESLIQTLGDPKRMHVERYWTAEQLAIRHRIALDFEVEMLFEDQQAALAELGVPQP